MSEALAGMRFGLIADTHDVLVDWPKALASIRAALGEVDAILYCGDMTSPAAVETLAGIAPVYATRNAEDAPVAPPRITDGPRTFIAGGKRIGLIFTLGENPELGPALAERVFGPGVEVVVHGGTHEPSIAREGGVLFVNPGSPTLAKRKTLAVLTITPSIANAEIVDVS